MKENGAKVFIKIFVKHLTLKLLSSKIIIKYYQEGACKMIRKLNEIKELLVLMG